MIYPNKSAFTSEEIDELCAQYKKHNSIDVETSEQYGVKRGLRNSDGTGVLAGLTNICDVVGYEKDDDGNVLPIDGKLYYRGFDVEDIINSGKQDQRFLFEEVMWLLLFGDLPSSEQLTKFSKLIDTHRELPEGFSELMIFSAPSKSIMNKLQRSVLAMYGYDENPDDTSLNNVMRQSIALICELPAMMIYAYQAKVHTYDHGSLFFHYPQAGLSTAEHILAISRSQQDYTKEEAHLLDTCLVLHMDHGGGNNSTFTSRVLSSTGTDTYSAISAAIGSLKGPKHGGANHKVLQQLNDILENVDDVYDDEKMKDYLRKLINKEAGDKSGLIYGMGHAVYTLSDPRAQLLKKELEPIAEETGYAKEYHVLNAIERLAPDLLKEQKQNSKNVCANIDLYSGLVYQILGISEDLYTPLFAVARIPGWCAHRIEELEFANRIMRPAYKCIYDKREYVALDDRKKK